MVVRGVRRHRDDRHESVDNAERVAAIERGEEALSDWAVAKKRLTDRLR